MKKKITLFATLIVAVVVIILCATSFYTVKENEYAFILRFQKIEKIISEPGLHIKIPFMDSVKTLPKNVQLYDLVPSDVLTSDSKAMSVDSYITWRISDPLAFYKSLGTIPEAKSRLDAATYNALKNIIGTIKQEAIIAPPASDDGGRDDLNLMVTTKVKESTIEYGIEVKDVKIKRFDLPSENEQAVYRRMISDRNQIAERYVAQGKSDAEILRNQVDKTVNILVSDAEARAAQIVAEGESEYMNILAQAYNSNERQELYVFMRSLDALKASMTGTDKTIVLGSDSELGKILNGVSN